MEMNFCRRCGTKLRVVEGHVYSCENNHTLFANASPTSGLWIVNDNNEALVAVRGREPGAGLFDVPGGFCDGAETFEAALSRELEEEVGLKPTDYTKPQYLVSGIDTYHFGGETTDVLGAIYWARIIGNPALNPQDDVAEARFIPINEIDPTSIYFDAVRAGFLLLKDTLTNKD